MRESISSITSKKLTTLLGGQEWDLTLGELFFGFLIGCKIDSMKLV